MTTAQERVSTWSRRFAVGSSVFLLAFGAGSIPGLPWRTTVVLGLYGFVLHMVFGKAYALVPTYFDRDLASSWLPVVQFPLSVLGTICLAIAPLVDMAGPTVDPVPAGDSFAAAGATLWLAGVLVFVGGLLWTVRGNLSGAATATGGHNSDRTSIDRFANAFVPVAMAYLLLGSYERTASITPLPPVFDGSLPRATHLLAVGTATLLVFAIGFRLFPRFLRTSPPAPLVWVALPAGAVAPIGLAWSVPAGDWLLAFAALQGTAVLAYALAIVLQFRTSANPRIGVYSVVAGALMALLVVGLGLSFGLYGLRVERIVVHARIGLVGFLGLTILGVAYQFYPPAASVYPVAGDRTAGISIGAIAAGLLVELGGTLTGVELAIAPARGVVLLGIVLYVYLLLGTFASR